MIITLEELTDYGIEVCKLGTEKAAKAQIRALELMIRAYTHNNFIVRESAQKVDFMGGKIRGISSFYTANDTVEITESPLNNGIVDILEIENGNATIGQTLRPGSGIIYLVNYPEDVRQGIVNLVKWEMTNRGKVGIKRETLSRHSVDYFDQDSSNTVMGYPVSLLGFLKPYVKARF